MRLFIGILLIVSCFVVVGMIEDPCHTEGLPTGCMESK